MNRSPWIVSALMPVLVAACVCLFAPRIAQAQHTTTGAEPLPVEVATVSFAGEVENFLLDKANQRIYVTDQSGTLSVLSTTDYSVIATLPSAPSKRIVESR